MGYCRNPSSDEENDPAKICRDFFPPLDLRVNKSAVLESNIQSSSYREFHVWHGVVKNKNQTYIPTVILFF